MLDSVSSCEVSGRVLFGCDSTRSDWCLTRTRSTEHIPKTRKSTSSTSEYTLCRATIGLHVEELFGNFFYEATLRIGRVVPKCVSFMRASDIERELGTSDSDIHEATLFLECTPIDE